MTVLAVAVAAMYNLTACRTRICHETLHLLNEKEKEKKREKRGGGKQKKVEKIRR